MKRRSYVRTASVVGAFSIAGCLGSDPDPGDDSPGEDTPTDSSGETTPDERTPDAGTPDDGPAEETPTEGPTPEAANEYGYATLTRDGVDVPLVPYEDAYEWYGEENVLFVDARDDWSYNKARIAGAVLSPAPDGLDDDDPVAAVSQSTKIVTYCVCPHTLASMRAASLIKDGYVHAYAIDEGLRPWLESGYPAEGDDVARLPDTFSINGRTDPSLAGEFAWVRHIPSGQREVTEIKADGRFEMDVHFHDVGPETEVSLSTPEAEVTDTLGTFASSVVDV